LIGHFLEQVETARAYQQIGNEKANTNINTKLCIKTSAHVHLTDCKTVLQSTQCTGKNQLKHAQRSPQEGKHARNSGVTYYRWSNQTLKQLPTNWYHSILSLQSCPHSIRHLYCQ